MLTTVCLQKQIIIPGSAIMGIAHSILLRGIKYNQDNMDTTTTTTAAPTTILATTTTAPTTILATATEEEEVTGQLATESTTGLCYDVLLHLFKFLDLNSLGRCAKVCTGWKVAAYHPSLWADQLIEIPGTGLGEEEVLSLKDRGVTAVSIKQDWLSIIPTNHSDNDYPYEWYYDHERDRDDGYSHMYWKIEESQKDKFLKCEVQLSALLKCVESLGVQTLIISDSPLRFNMEHKFTGLKRLCLIDPDVDIDTFVGVLDLMDNLEHLYINSKNRLINSCRFFQKKDKDRFNCFNVSQDIIRNKQSLRSLEIVSLNWSISYNWGNTNLDFGTAPQLEKLVLTDTIELCDDLLEQVSEKLPNLKHLHIPMYGESSIPAFKLCFPSLQSLKIERDTIFRSDGINLSLISSILMNSPNIIALDLSKEIMGPEDHGEIDEPEDDRDDNVPENDACSVNYADILTLVGSCPSLKVINISGCESFNPPSMMRLLTVLPNLEVLIALGTADFLWDSIEPDIIRGHDNLRSVLVENNPSWLNQLPNLSYKFVSGDILRKKADDKTWTRVKHGSKHWKEAFSWSYFHLSDEFDFTSRYNTPGSAVDLWAQRFEREGNY